MTTLKPTPYQEMKAQRDESEHTLLRLTSLNRILERLITDSENEKRDLKKKIDSLTENMKSSEEEYTWLKTEIKVLIEEQLNLLRST